MHTGAASSASNFMSPAAVCPGSEVTFTCTVVDPGVPYPGTTIWTIGTSRCGLSHSTAPDIQHCGPQFNATLLAPQGNCYTSTVTAKVNQADNGLPVMCYRFEEDPNLVVGNATVEIIGGCTCALKLDGQAGVTMHAIILGQEI